MHMMVPYVKSVTLIYSTVELKFDVDVSRIGIKQIYMYTCFTCNNIQLAITASCL